MMIFQAEKEPDEFEPIPLTPEWLERLGFIQGRQNADRNLFYATGAHAAIYSISLSGGVMLHRADIKMLLEQHVEYVHQLQNLYFALSNGQELTVKEMA